MSSSAARQNRNLAPGGDAMGLPSRLAWTRHLRLAMLFAAPVLALLALALIDRGARRAVVMGACAGYYILLMAGEALVYEGLPPVAGAWLANIVFAIGAIVLLIDRERPG